jgi:hypothetical protein
VSLLSGRCVDGSVDGGEKMSTTAGVFGGSASRLISAVGTGSGKYIGSSGGVMMRLMFRRARPRDFEAGAVCFSGFSWAEERCFFGDNTGSVLTGSETVSFRPKSGRVSTYCCPAQVAPGMKT